MQLPPSELLREAAERNLAHLEDQVAVAVTAAMRSWLQAVGFLVIREVLQQQGITAAGYAQPDRAVDAATAAWNEWQRGLDNDVLPAVAIAFGEGFQQVRLQNRGVGSFTPQQEHMMHVADRLRIWPERAFEDLRPELVEALAEAETIEQIKDRVGRVLEIDTDSRAIKARINEVEVELSDPTVEGADRADLRQLRRELWEEYDDALSKWEWKARRIARTEVHGAVNAGQIAAARQAETEGGDTYYKRWLSTEDVRTRVTHRVADGQTVPLSGKFRVGGFMLDFPGDPVVVAPHEVINCVVGSTRVEWPGQGVRNITRRRYRGTFVHLVTVDGHELTITPNHPVLTSAGYVRAGDLSPGGDVIASRFVDAPNVGKVPPRIEEVYRALSERGMEKRVIAGGVNFHGDVSSDDEIGVVWADGELPDVLDAEAVRDAGERVLGSLSDGPGTFAGRGACVRRADLDGAAGDGSRSLGAAGVVGVEGEGPAVVGGQSGHSQDVGLGAGPHGEPEGVESADDSGSPYADGPRHLKDAYAVGMEAAELIEVNVYFGDHFVYNLSTDKAWYLSDGILVHNCRCTLLILDPDTLQDSLQGPDASLGEVRPGGIRLGADDPDDAQAAILEAAQDEHRTLPPDVTARGEDHGQAAPPDTPDVELTDHRDDARFADPAPADVDLTDRTEDELLQLMTDTADGDDGMFEAARNEYDRRTIDPDYAVDDTLDEQDKDEDLTLDDLIEDPAPVDDVPAPVDDVPTSSDDVARWIADADISEAAKPRLAERMQREARELLEDPTADRDEYLDNVRDYAGNVPGLDEVLARMDGRATPGEENAAAEAWAAAESEWFRAQDLDLDLPRRPEGTLVPPEYQQYLPDPFVERHYTRAANVVGANPNQRADTAYQVNCQRCVQAVELRYRGFDVEAAPNVLPSPDVDPADWSVLVTENRPDDPTLRPDLARKFDVDGEDLQLASFTDLWREQNGGVREFAQAYDRADVEAQILASAPLGARGWIAGVWRDVNSAHVLSWEVDENRDGVREVVWMDGQIGDTGRGAAIGRFAYGSLKWIRVDDLVPTKLVETMVKGRTQ